MTVDTQLREVRINGKWPLWLPEYRAESWDRWAGGWEKERLEATAQVIRPGDVVYDIGTEEGDFSALYAQWCWAGRKVYTCHRCGHSWHSASFTYEVGYDLRDCPRDKCGARVKTEPRRGGVVLFEPDDRVWPNIRAIFEGNGLRPLDCWVGFAGDRAFVDFDNQARLAHGPKFDVWPECAYGPAIDDHGFCNLGERPDIPAISIDRHAEIRGLAPDVITLDVEGSEDLVLIGARRVLTQHRPVVFVSIHPEFMREMYGMDPEDLHCYMSDLGYEGTHLATDHEEHWAFTHPEGRQL